MNHWLRNILILTLWTGCKGQDEVTQTGGDVTATEGDSVTLNCSYKTSYAPTLFWYQQKPGSSPQLLISDYSGNKDGFSFIHQKERKEFHLEISSAALSHSAVYYCALEPTVTGNTKTLYKNLWSKDNTILHNSH
ncbi:uncharacterized protein V6R79_010437 [Siganus canaliculatus]